MIGGFEAALASNTVLGRGAPVRLLLWAADDGTGRPVESVQCVLSEPFFVERGRS